MATSTVYRGIRLFDYDAYKPNYKGNFKCLDGSREIPFDHLNDNYCDCVSDGSDEPSTNACSNGRFYCKYQKRHITGRGLDVWVWASRVNDNVCDCCDGSDEWTTNANCQNHCAQFCLHFGWIGLAEHQKKKNKNKTKRHDSYLIRISKITPFSN